MSFETLSTELKNLNFEARTEEAKKKEGEGEPAKSPCPSQLHLGDDQNSRRIPKKSPSDPDQMAAEEHTKLFGEENLQEYSVDSTEDTCTAILKEVMVAMKTELHRQTVKYGILARLVSTSELLTVFIFLSPPF